MEVLNLIRLFWEWIFPYISRIHTAYIGEDSSILGTNDMFGEFRDAGSGVKHHMCQGLNSHYFHIIGDKLINPIGVYIPIINIIRIPSLKVGGFPSPKKRDNLDHGTGTYFPRPKGENLELF